MEQIPVRVNKAMREAIEHVAQQDGGSLSMAVRSLLQDALSRRGVPPYGDAREWVAVSKRGAA